jgi:DNA invertase Pin-like site-specific DNA recombinase
MSGIRAAIYVRISNDPEGLAHGVGRQREDCTKLALARGWIVAAVYDDNDISASGKAKRPGWDRLIADLESGAVDAVVAYSSSRLYRNLRDLTRLIDLANDHVPIATCVSGNIDLSTADGRMMARMLATVDQAEWERVSERVKRAQTERSLKGLWNGGSDPFGYDPISEDGGKRLVVNEREAGLIQEAAQAILSGVSLNSIRRDWGARGIKTTRGNAWTVSHLRSMLKRPLPGIINPVDTRRLNDLFDGRTVPGRQRAMLTGLLVCGVCGGSMISRPSKGVPGYVCHRTGTVHLSVNGREVERVVVTSAESMMAVGSSLLDPSDPVIAERESVRADLMALGDNGMPDDYNRARALKLQAKLDELDAELERIALEPRDDMPVVIGLDLPGIDVQAQLDEVSRDPRTRAWIESLVESVTVAPANRGSNRFDGGRVSIGWREGVAPR